MVISAGQVRLSSFLPVAASSPIAVKPTRGILASEGDMDTRWSFSGTSPALHRQFLKDIQMQQVGVVQAAWTRRSAGEAAKRPNRKSWKQRTDMYMRPFLLDVFFSKRYIHAKVVHRGTSKVVSGASTNAKDLRNTLPSLIDYDACRTIGQLIAERSMEADIFAMSYDPKKNEQMEGKLAIILDTIKEKGIMLV